MGSQRSGGSGGAYVEPATTGQKRKRVTRQTTNENKKRKEIAQDRRQQIVEDHNGHLQYVAPLKPIKKASEVYVQPIKDVSA